MKESRLSMNNQTKKATLIIKKKNPKNPELTLIIKHNSFRKKINRIRKENLVIYE